MEWKEGEYDVVVSTMGDGTESRKVIGLVSGVFGINDRYAEPELYDDNGPQPALTHLPTQRAVAKGITVTRAKQLAEELAKACPSLLTAESAEDIPGHEQEEARGCVERYTT